MRLLVLVLGAGGQLGEAMVDRLGYRHEVVGLTHADLDITAPGPVRAAITSVCPDVVINCAAFTQVDQAEETPVQAIATNAWAVRSIARAAAEIDAAFVHYSTDFVFDGSSTRPYTEEDPPNPRSAYAVSKLLGEWFAADAPRHYVLRVESLFGGRLKSSVDRILNMILTGQQVRAFTDRTVSPSYVADVVEATRSLIEKRSPYGLYHCVNEGWTTWLGLATELATLAKRPDAPIVGTEMSASGLKAQRPKFAALSSAKLANAGFEMPSWQDALARYVKTVTAADAPGV